MDRTDLDIPESTVWPASDDAPQAPVASREALDDAAAEAAADPSGESPAIELGPGEADDRSSGEQIPSLDPDRDDAERNAAAGGWEGANEQIENDFETEQLREREDRDEKG
jgi:hypothetical protein